MDAGRLARCFARSCAPWLPTSLMSSALKTLASHLCVAHRSLVMASIFSSSPAPHSPPAAPPERVGARAGTLAREADRQFSFARRARSMHACPMAHSGPRLAPRMPPAHSSSASEGGGVHWGHAQSGVAKLVLPSPGNAPHLSLAACAACMA